MIIADHPLFQLPGWAPGQRLQTCESFLVARWWDSLAAEFLGAVGRFDMSAARWNPNACALAYDVGSKRMVESAQRLIPEFGTVNLRFFDVAQAP